MSDQSLSAEQLFSKVSSALRSGNDEAVDDLLKLPNTDFDEKEVVEAPVAQPVATPEPATPSAPEPTPPAAATPAEPVPTPEVQPPAPTPDQTDAWISALPDDVREKVEGLRNQYKEVESKARRAEEQWRSNAQRMPAYQRTIANLTSKLADLEPLARKVPAASIEKDEDLKRIAEHDPELAKTIANFQNRRERGMAEAFDSRIKEVVSPISNEIDQAYVMEQHNIVRQQIDNLDEVVSSPWFQGWFEHQTPGVKKLAESPHAADAIRLIQMYGMDVEQYQRATAAPAAPSTPAPVATPVAAPNPSEDAKAQEILDSRNRRVAAAAAPSSSPAPVNLRSAQPESEEALQAIFRQAFSENIKQITRK